MSPQQLFLIAGDMSAGEFARCAADAVLAQASHKPEVGFVDAVAPHAQQSTLRNLDGRGFEADAGDEADRWSGGVESRVVAVR